MSGQVGVSLRKRPPSHDTGSVRLHFRFRIPLLAEHVRLQLVHGRLYFGVFRHIHEAVGIEVREADGTYLSVPHGFLHSPPRARIVAERLVDKQQVDVVGAQLAERFIDATGGFFLSGIGNPYFRREEQFAARHTAFGDRCAHALFIVIRLRRVNQPITCADGIKYATLALFERYLKHSISQYRHFDAVIQFYCFHINLF